MSVKATTWAWAQDVAKGELLVLLALADHADDEGICWPGHKGLEAKCRMSRSTLLKHISAMASRGLLTIRHRHQESGYRDTNLYVLHLDGQQSLSLDSGLWPGKPTGHQGPKNRRQGPEISGQGPKTRPKSSLTVNEPSESDKHPPGQSPDSLLERFDEVQRAYPPREGSQEWPRARRAWKARMRQGIDPDILIAAAEHYRRHCEAERKLRTPYVKMAATFLGPDRYWESVHELPTNNRAERREDRNRAVAEDWARGPH